MPETCHFIAKNLPKTCKKIVRIRTTDIVPAGGNYLFSQNEPDKENAQTQSDGMGYSKKVTPAALFHYYEVEV